MNQQGIESLKPDNAMLTRHELLLFSVTITACVAGYLLPEVAPYTGWLPSMCLITLMFLSFLSIPVKEVAEVALRKGRTVIWLSVIKMIVMPLLVWSISYLLIPEYAMVMLLMAGICSGSTCPYFAILLKGDAPLIVVLVAATSLMAPLTLPILVKILGGSDLHVSPLSLGFSLSTFIVLPMIMAELFRRFFQTYIAPLVIYRGRINVGLFALTNFTIFANNSVAISESSANIGTCFIVACVAALIFVTAGFISALPFPAKQRTSAMLAFAMTNNILVIVLSGSYFGSNELLVAAMYTVPFFLVILPIRILSEITAGEE